MLKVSIVLKIQIKVEVRIMLRIMLKLAHTNRTKSKNHTRGQSQ